MSEHDMHLLEPAPFGRILPAMVTPMKSDGSVDFAAAQKLAKYLVADGADGLVVNGTTGESPVTHMDEKVELVRAVKEVVDVPVISGAGSNDTAHTVRMVEQTQEAGADAVLVVMPYYSRPSQDGIVGHYKAVDESAEKPSDDLISVEEKENIFPKVSEISDESDGINSCGEEQTIEQENSGKED